MKSRVSPWASWGLCASFLLAVITGIIINYPYRAEIPLISTVGIEGTVPFGALFRYLHYYSGQLAFLLLIWHTTEALLGQSYRYRRPFFWTTLISTYPLTLLVLFTGYIIRGDETGLLAGRIAENLALKLPLIGELINRLLFAVMEEGAHRAYLAHVFLSWGLLVGLISWHFRLRRLELEDLALWASVALLLALLFPPSLEFAPLATHAKGPWFFLGIQEALRYFSPYLAGLLFPALPLLLLWLCKWWPKRAALGLLLWHVVYLSFTLAGALR